MSASSEISSFDERKLTNSFLWLDTSVNSKENVDVKQKLRSFIHHLQTFEKLDQCEQYIQSVSSQDRLVLIVRSELSQQLLPRIHYLPQIYSIYIYCANEELYQPLTQQYSKVKGVYSQFDKLITQIQGNRMRRMRDSMDEPLSMSIHNPNINDRQSTSDIDGRFVHSQLLIDCLLRMQSTSTDINEFVSLCLNKNHENKQTLKIIKEFQETYSSDHSIWWYTRDTFLYRLLNESLRVQDIDSLFGLRFIICDIEQQLRQNQCSSAVCLYRGQLIAKEELEILRQSKGELISMNSFLSTTLDREMALWYLPLPNQNEDDKLEPVLFEIDVDPCREGMKPFADISSLSAFPVENEVLMMAGSVFRLDDIHMDEDQRWIINMTLCSDHDHDLKSVVDHMKDQYGTEQTRLLVFGHVLVDMAYFDDAEKYYLRLLKELPPDDSDIPHCYHALGKVACEKADYESSLQWFHKSHEIVRKKVRKGHSRIGFIHISMGEAYQKKGDNKQALKSYEKALRIWTKIYNDQHEYVAWCFNNIGNIYDAEKKYSEALNYHKKALEIKERILPPQHPCLGNGYLNIGNVYYHLGQYDKALGNYQLSKKIYEMSLTAEHPSIANALKSIGIIAEVTGNFCEALQNYKKALFIRVKCFSRSHPYVTDIEQDIDHVLSKMK